MGKGALATCPTGCMEMLGTLRFAQPTWLTVSDMVLVFATILPSRINDLDQVIAVVEERHRKRRKDLERRSRGCGDLQRWAQSG